VWEIRETQMNGYTAASALNHKGGWTRNNSPIQIDKKKKSLP